MFTTEILQVQSPKKKIEMDHTIGECLAWLNGFNQDSIITYRKIYDPDLESCEEDLDSERTVIVFHQDTKHFIRAIRFFWLVQILTLK